MSSSLLGFPYTPMHSMLPFLCLGIGIDDMFVIVQVKMSNPVTMMIIMMIQDVMTNMMIRVMIEMMIRMMIVIIINQDDRVCELFVCLMPTIVLTTR